MSNMNPELGDRFTKFGPPDPGGINTRPQLGPEFKGKFRMANGAADDEPDSDERKRFMEMLGFTSGERGSPEKLLKSEKGAEVVLGVRLLEGRELELWAKELIEPNFYAIDYETRMLISRSLAARFVRGLTENENLSDEDRRERKELAVACRLAAFEAAAFKRIIEHVNEEDNLRDDIETIALKRFVSPGKKELPFDAMKVLFDADKTWEGEARFSEKVASAIDSFVKIGKGEAVVTFSNPTIQVENYTPEGTRKVKVFTKEVGSNGEVAERQLGGGETIIGTFPNIWAFPENSEILDLATQMVVLPDIRKLRRSGARQSEEGKALGEEDDKNAAMMGYVLMRALKLNLKFALGTRGIGAALDPGAVTPEDVQIFDLDTNDDRQKFYLAVRSRREHGGKYNKDTKKFEGSREHRRAAGSLVVIYGCMPSLVATLPELLVTDVIAKKKRINEGMWVDIPNGKSLDTSVYNACFEGSALVLEEGKLVEYQFDRKSIKDVWVGIKKISLAFDDKKNELITRGVGGREMPAVEISRGIDQNTLEINFGLLGFYAFQLWDKLIGTDFLEQYNGIVATGSKEGFLIKWNKYWDVVLGFLGGAYGLGKDLSDKLNNYVRTMYLAGVIRAVSSGTLEDKNIAAASQITDPVTGTDRERAISKVKRSARMVGFLPNKNGKIDQWAEKLIRRVAETGEPITPFDLKEESPLAKEIGFSFSHAELVKISPLYPFTAYP